MALKDGAAARRAIKTIRVGVKILAHQPEAGRPVEDMDPAFREWLTDFGGRKTQENTGKHRKTQENTGKHRKTQENTGKHRKTQENTGKHRKTQENTGKHRKTENTGSGLSVPYLSGEYGIERPDPVDLWTAVDW